MTPDEYARWISNFRRHHQLGGDPEDLCQEFLTRKLEGRVNPKQSLKYFIIDRLRQDSGRSDTKNYEARKTQFDMNHWASIVNTSEDPTEQMNNYVDVKRLIDTITGPKSKLMAQLYFLDGFSAPEIAKILSLDESGVYTAIKLVMIKLKRRVLSARPPRRHSPSAP